MNKRQRKKFDEKLYKAIRELNEDVLEDLDGEVELSEQGLLDAFDRVKKNNTMDCVFKAHKRLISKR